MNEVKRDTVSIRWNFNSEELVKRFTQNLEIALMGIELKVCNRSNCRDKTCSRNIDEYYGNLSDTIKNVGRATFGTSRSRCSSIVPGWNSLVKDYHDQARQAFLTWRRQGSLRSGEAAEHMRATRARFKLALRECRASEERLRVEAQAEKIACKDMKGYWRDIRKVNPRSAKVTNHLDGVQGDIEISKLWRTKYMKLFNSVDHFNKHILHIFCVFC